MCIRDSCRPYPGAYDRQQQHGQPGGQLGQAVRTTGEVRQQRDKQVEEPRKNQAERDLEHIQQQRQTAAAGCALPCAPVRQMQHQLDQHENAVQHKRGVAKVERKDLGDAVRNRDDRGNPQPGLGVECQTEREDQQTQNVEQRPVTGGFFHDIVLLSGWIFFLLLL